MTPEPAQARFRLWLWAIIAVGVLLSGAIASVTHGQPYDMQSFRLVRDALDQDAWGVYRFFARHGVFRWPYPPGFFPWVYASGWTAAHGGPSFEFMIRVPTILADAALAWVVQDFLAWRGEGQRMRLGAAALVSLGPSFVIIAGYHGQIDALAILPGAVGVSLWSRTEAPWRAIAVGLLIGIGGTLKTVPLLLVLAVLPSTRSPREAVTLLGAAALPLVIAFAPFAIAGTLPTTRILSYRGLPGLGDLSLVVQPNLAQADLGTGHPAASSLSSLLFRHGNLVVAAGLLLVVLIGARTRAPAARMAVVLWLGVYVFGVDFFFQYLVWGLPFFLMAGYVRAVAVAELALIGPALLFYLAPWHASVLALAFAIIMIAAWAAALVSFVVLAGRLDRERRLARA